jgi:hypothetical protein
MRIVRMRIGENDWWRSRFTWYTGLMPGTHLVGIRMDVSPNVRRLLRMRAAELNISQAQYVAALIINDTQHFGSIPDTETEDADNDTIACQ